MKVVSVINFKGGVGKTTLTANLGAYAASQGYKVLLVDLDYQKTLTCTFMTNEDWKKKFSKTKTMKIFFEPVLNGQLPSLKPLLVRRAVANEKLDLLCSHDDLRIIEPKLTGLLSNVDVPSLAADYMKFVSCLRRALNNIDNLYDLVLLDCRPDSYFMAKCGLYASDYYIVPTKLNEDDTSGIEPLRNELKSYRAKCNEYISRLTNSSYLPMNLKMLGIVPMMTHVSSGKTLIKAEQVFRDKLEGDFYVFNQFIKEAPGLFGSKIRDKTGAIVPVVLSGSAVTPFIGFSPKAAIIRDLKALGDEFLEQVGLKKLTLKKGR